MYTVEDIKKILQEAKDLGLQIPEPMLEATPESLSEICNGIGCEHPEHIGSITREALNKVMSFAVCSAAIHDFCYYSSDGTEESRLMADKMFRSNMLDEIDGRKIHWKLLRQRIALEAYAMVRKYGRSDWCIAFAEKQNKKDK